MKKWEFLHHYYNGYSPNGYSLLDFVKYVDSRWLQIYQEQAS